MCKTVLLCLTVIGTQLFSLYSFAGFPVAGIYTGHLKTSASRTVPLQVQLTYSNAEVPGQSDDIFSFKKELLARFIIDQEHGPFLATRILYNVSTQEIEISYSRPNSAQQSLSMKGIFGMTHEKHPFIRGKVLSAKSSVADFEIGLDPKKESLEAQVNEKNIGTWEGEWTLSGGATYHVRMPLQPAGQVTLNPQDMELDFSPGRVGAFVVDESVFYRFSNVSIDPFSDQIRVFYSNTSENGGGLSVVLSRGPDGESWIGDGFTSFKGEKGRILLRRKK